MIAGLDALKAEFEEYWDYERSPQTEDKYRRISRNAHAQRKDPVEFVEAAPAGQFVLTRAAMVWDIWRTISDWLIEADCFAQLGELENEDGCHEEAVRLKGIIDQIKELRAPEGEYTRKGKSKRTDLKKLPSDWQERLIAEIPDKSLPAVLVSLLGGCRPKELQAGVSVTVHSKGQLKLTINGAKVTDSSGQPWREIIIDASESVPARLLWKLASNSAEPLLAKREPRTLHKCLSVASKKAGIRPVSAYTARHSFASILKRSWSGDKVRIAKALGHVSTATQKAYGTTQQARQRGNVVVEVAAARVVREPHRPHPEPDARPLDNFVFAPAHSWDDIEP